MSIPEHRQQRVDEAVDALTTLEGEVSAAQVSKYVERIPDALVRLYLWSSLSLAAAFMGERESRRGDEELED